MLRWIFHSLFIQIFDIESCSFEIIQEAITSIDFVEMNTTMGHFSVEKPVIKQLGSFNLHFQCCFYNWLSGTHQLEVKFRT